MAEQDNNQAGSKQEATSYSNSELEAAREQLRNAQKEFEQQKWINQRQQRELDAMRREHEARSRQAQSYESEDPSELAMKRLTERLSAQSQEMGLMRFKLETPNWNDTWSKVQEIINDPVRAQDVAVFDREGEPDWYKSLRNAHTAVELEELRKLKAETAVQKQKAISEQERQKAQATISGVSASAGVESVNVDKMTSDEMLEKGLVEMDPNDPIRPRKPKTG